MPSASGSPNDFHSISDTPPLQAKWLVFAMNQPFGSSRFLRKAFNDNSLRHMRLLGLLAGSSSLNDSLHEMDFTARSRRMLLGPVAARMLRPSLDSSIVRPYTQINLQGIPVVREFTPPRIR
jgi:hypothetical protein